MAAQQGRRTAPAGLPIMCTPRGRCRPRQGRAASQRSPRRVGGYALPCTPSLVPLSTVGLGPHALHHIGFLARTALIAAAGAAVFGLLCLVAATPLLLRLSRRFGSWWAPAIELAVFRRDVRGVGVRDRPGH